MLLDFFAVAQERRRKKLEETSETQEGLAEFGSGEADPGFPFVLFVQVGEADRHFNILEHLRLQPHPGSRGNWSTGQVQADRLSYVFGEDGIVRTGVEQSVTRYTACRTYQRYRYDGAWTVGSPTQGNNRMTDADGLVTEAHHHSQESTFRGGMSS